MESSPIDARAQYLSEVRCYCSRFDCNDAGWANVIDAAVAGLVVCIWVGREVEGKGEIAGHQAPAFK
jgi:hypothetical protein